MLRVGARIVASSSFSKTDAMRGTQLLLTASGRLTLADSYRDAFLSGASAVLTSLDTSHAHLDKTGFFEDMSRDNDLAYYEVGKGNGEGGFALQNNGYTFLIPREMVSVGERRDAAGLLAELATAAVKQGRAAALAQSPDLEVGLVGTTIQFSSREDGTHLADGSLHLGLRLENQITSAAKMQPDFFAIAGCASAEDVDLVARILARNALTMERRYRVNLKGMKELEEHPTPAGFEIPALLLSSSPPCEALTEMVEAAAKSPHICGVAAPTAIEEAELDLLQPKLREGTMLVGASEAAGELTVRRCS